MNWTKEQAEAAQADYVRKMQRAADRRLSSSETVARDGVGCQAGRPGGENDQTGNAEMGKKRTERHQDKRSHPNQGVGMGKIEIVHPAKPQEESEPCQR